MAMLPLLELGPDPRERGRVHGRAMAVAIRDNLNTYLDRFEAGGVRRSLALDQADAWSAVIARENGEYAEEMDAVAEGAGLSSTQITLLNARYEIAYSGLASEAQAVNAAPARRETEGCTSFGLMPSATRNGHTIIGQNWDWLGSIRGRTFVMRVVRTNSPGDGKPNFIGFTEGGIVGPKMGVNAAGIGLCVNGIVTAREGANPFRKPFHVRCREILDAPTYDKALQAVVQTDRTCSANFLIAHAEGEILDIEATPDHCAYIYPENGLLTHANHLVKETRVASEFERIAPHTLYRAVRLERLLRRHCGKIDLDVIASALSDHFSAPAAICRHPDPSLPEAKRVITVAAIAIDLNTRTLYATDGQLCASPFQSFPLDASEAASVAA
jgi:isopenicillin-N N-acyltransferase-like protein